ncbi:hypothetical protein HYPSUDRAFT_206454 [Hypholoma sublateritium FD-334 SS-4]|uniref:Uncharacterized protein n=1 Tax=Hypholoma sublateritium (strain FD-334 SS-4) TaxID=945553 RepID=A0A0D2NKW7_HYPSF|nr:hypothetical protein HYPSUDRAFT_206454 [Hypholoma sublateritium FD-334 SS-4]
MSSSKTIVNIKSSDILVRDMWYVIVTVPNEEFSLEVQLNTIHSLQNSSLISKTVIVIYVLPSNPQITCRQKGKRNYIVQVIRETSQNASVAVQTDALEYLVRVMNLYCYGTGLYMTDSRLADSVRDEAS